MKKYYSLCKKLICIEAESFPGDNPLWSQFEVEGGVADINISCKVCEPFPEMPGESKGKAGEFLVSVAGDTVYRALPMGTVNGALTKYTPADTSFSETFFTRRSFPVMMDSRYMWSSVSLFQLLLAKNAFFIHSSYISVGGKAILFSAACGVGKSTQAALWEKHRNAEIINGDKAGILVENDVYACGVPFCGTSGICKNRNLPLGAIVLLSQSAENSVRRLAGVDIELTAAEAEIVGDGATAGVCHLDGDHALMYARIRKIDSDFNRTSRQRNVLNAVFKKVKNCSVSEILGLVDELLPIVTTDMSNSQITSLAIKYAPSLASLSIETYSVPPKGTYKSAMIRGMAVLVPDRYAIKKIIFEEYLPM